MGAFCKEEAYVGLYSLPDTAEGAVRYLNPDIYV